LTFGNYAQDGVLNQQSAIDFCCNSPGFVLDFYQAIDNTAGCLIYPVCFLQQTIGNLLVPDATISEGQFLTNTVNALCLAEQSGEKQPAGGCDNQADICPPDICD
jgi:hypothetical protein